MSMMEGLLAAKILYGKSGGGGGGDIVIPSWSTLVKLTQSGNAKKYMSVGDVITSTYWIGTSVYPCPWLVMDFRDVELQNGKTYHDVPIIQMQYTTHENCVFDPAETNEATEATAQAGYYYVGNTSSTWQVLSLSAGDTIPYGDWTKVYKTEWNSVNAVRHGTNNWKLSWTRQYLNHAGTGWAEKQHELDVLPSNAANITGFMSYMPQDMLDILHPIKITTKQSNYMGGGTDTTYDTFWLASIAEMNMSNSNASTVDGEPWQYYKELFDSDTKIPTGTYDVMKHYAVNATTSAQYCWCRSAIVGYHGEWDVGSSGFVGGSGPNSASRLLPACAII